MIRIDKTEVLGWETAIRGMRNPMNSWVKSDSTFCKNQECDDCTFAGTDENFCKFPNRDTRHFIIGSNDLDLMRRLAKAGPVEGKFRRMIAV